ncbi:MAG: primosomal protein N' [Candidatus Paceibacterota bacterium]|jgi:primosomal protein N' (replication factor Y)
MIKILKVIPGTKIPLNQPQLLTYFSKENIELGGLISVKLKNRKVAGVVFEAEDLRQTKMNLRKSNFKLKNIEKILVSSEIIDEKLRELILWTSLYYWEPAGIVLKSILTNIPLKELNKKESFYKNNKESKKKNDLSKKEFYSDINNEQHYKILLGAIKKERQVLELYPEIIKLEQAYEKLPESLKKKTLVFHSEIKKSQLKKNWLRILSGESVIIFSTRQGVFLPFKNLKLIIVNDENSLSYKSWDQHPKYNAKHVALKLSDLHKAKIIFTDKVLSFESYSNIKDEKYFPKTKLFEEKTAKIEIVDMIKLMEQGNKFSYFSPVLLEKIKNILNKNGTVLLFQNRRGLATYIYCKDCGYFYECPNCKSSLVYYRDANKLICHLCNHQENPPGGCRKCHGHLVKYSGHGTQRIYKEIANFFPETPIYLLDLNSAPTNIEKQKIIQNFIGEKKGKILIATSIIFGVQEMEFDLVSILNFDLLVNFPDFSTEERIIRLVRKLALSSKELIIQTYNPEDSLLKMLHSGQYEDIYKKELGLRKALSYPPYWQIISLKYRHKDEIRAEKESKKLFDQLIIKNKLPEGIKILGPMNSLKPKIKGFYYRSIILKVKRSHLKERNHLLVTIPDSWDIDVDTIEI